jgi:hypothetical protein
MSVWLYFMVYWIDYMLTFNMTALKVWITFDRSLDMKVIYIYYCFFRECLILFFDLVKPAGYVMHQQ